MPIANPALASPLGRQEGVKPLPEMLVAPVSLSDLRNLRLELSQSGGQFGLTLKRALQPRASKGFTRQYVHRLETGQDVITPEIATAFWRIAAAHDSVDPSIATTHPAQVYALNPIDGALVAGAARDCARAGCSVRFVPTHPRQKYHSVWCREQHYKNEKHGQ